MPSASSSPLSSPRRASKESEMYFRKSRAEDDVLVLGSVDLTAQGVGRFPEDFDVGQVGGSYVMFRHTGFSSPLFEC